MNRKLKSTSKFLSLVLRHKPETIGLELDPEGWLRIDKLIEHTNRHGKQIDLPTLHEVVATNDKKRFALSEDGLRIRASQGHSVSSVELKLEPVEPPDLLFHGTIDAFLGSIGETGLDKRSRNHVHLSSDESVANQVGARRGKPVLLKIDAKKMHATGYQFFLSANNVWLTDAVPPEFIEFPKSIL